MQDNKLSEYYPDYEVESSRTQRKKIEAKIKAWKRKSTLYKGVSENIEGMIEEERTELEEQLKAFRKQAPHSVFLAAASDEYLVQSVLSQRVHQISNREMQLRTSQGFTTIFSNRKE